MTKTLLFLIFATSLLFAACSDDDDPSSTGPGATTAVEEEVNAEEVLRGAAERATTVESFHFVLTHENGSTPLPLNLQLESAEGDVIVPDGLKAEVEAEAAGINVDVEVIGFEGRTWVTNPFTGSWQELNDTNIRDFANPEALVSDLLPLVQDPTIEGREQIDGVDTYVVAGTMDSGELQEALGVAEPGHQVDVRIWTGVEDELPRRVTLTGPLSDADDADVVRRVDLSRFDEPVEIMPPE